ncbi:hypothetical protein [Chryseobacterium shandongense]|uniref:hypothetical protein n=1 Tax=Chryseobacterium shandongense TaxID=1493872 RepID=UPI000F4E1F7E|nr:hypothetical protein [Chryseobacterium shandongense]AZA58191.1 hypothetical protein EG350_13795 [Chryseobacterium shandongense]
MNKPIMFTDPDGRYASQIQDLRNSMPNVYSGWENAQGVNFGDWNNFSNGSQFNEFVSQINASGLGGGGYTFTGNAAGSMYHYFADGGNINGITFKNGWAMWGILEGDPYVVGYDGDMYLSDTGSVVLHRARVENSSFDWYGPGGRLNWFIGATGSGVGNFAEKFYIGTARPNTPVKFLGQNFYGNGRTFVKAAPIAQAIGRFSFGLGVAMDGIGVYNYYYNKDSINKIHPAKAGLNTAMAAYGLTGAGTIPAILYFGVDAFYPAGWEGYGNDYQRIQSENANIIPGFITAPYGSQKF